MIRSAFLFLILAFVQVSTGCNKQDTECLSRMGRKIAVHAKSSAGEAGTKFDFGWAGGRREPTLQEKVQDRLRYENTLTEIQFEVTAKDKEIDLKGTVKTAIQRLRAIELTETVAGVEKVTESIKVLDAEVPDAQ